MNRLARAALVLMLAACAPQEALSPVEPAAPAAFERARVAKGAELAALGDCESCHTAPGGKSYAGGAPLKTPFGTFYGTNITPDAETGIGGWSEEAFARALREGVDRAGRHLYPAFPYEYYTRLSDDDIRALYAYFMTREPVRAKTPPHELRFPYSVRALLGAWKALYFHPDNRNKAYADRGAYLAEGIAHCGACHTPRSTLGAEIRERAYGGGEAEGWHAPALDASNPAPVPWSEAQLFTYLRTGLDARHAIAAGPMAPVVRELARVPENDVRALAAYFSPLLKKHTEEKTANASDPGGPGAEIYAGACAGCHDAGRDASSSGAALALALASGVALPTSRNLVRIVLEGIAPPEGTPGRFMPGFAQALTDAQLKTLMDYCRARFAPDAPAWGDVEQALREAREKK